MSHRIRPARFTFTALTLALAPFINAVAASPVVQFTSGLKNLQMEVIDLMPEDGMAPGLTHEAQVLFLSSIDSTQITLPVPSHQLLPTEPFSLDIVGQEGAFVTPTGISVVRNVLAEELINEIQPSGVTPGTSVAEIFPYMGIGTIQTLENGLGNAMPSVVTLAAHTQVVISGEAIYASTMDVSALKSLLADRGYTSFTLTESPELGYSGMVLRFDVSDWPVEFPQNGPTGFDWMSTAQDILRATDQTDDVLSVVRTMPFSMTLSNSSDESQTMPLMFGAMLAPALELTLLGGPIVTPPPVPEPATYALMGLGLVGIGLAASRRRRACR